MLERTDGSRGGSLSIAASASMVGCGSALLEVYLPWLDAQWAAGARNSAALWRQLKLQGFRGSRRADRIELERLQRVPSARTLARLLTTARDSLSRPQTVTIAAIEAGVPALVEAREIIAAFQVMVRERAHASLDPWITKARTSLVGSFANGIGKHHGAVLSAITSSWSSGQVEGQITRLKLVKRQMYGRAKLHLLEAHLVPAP